MSSALKICPTCGTEYPANERFCNRDGAALRSQEAGADLVGSVIADRYHIMKKLGEGGMGQVYLAEHVKMGRKSAVKVMHPGMVQDVDAISRFNREAANASRINHPNVAGIYDFGETPDGIIYLAMEFIEGQSLTSLIEQQGALAPARAAEITRQASEGLAVAHDMGIVHRDLKPDNIMIARTRDGGDIVKVVDFGIAKAAGSENQKVTKTGLVVGTPEYMSPEQLSGDKLDGRSDIYSLGLVAFNMLTGTLPFPSDSAQETMIMRLTDKPKPLGTMKPDVNWPADVQAVMDKVLERDANLRYQSAAEFGRELFLAVERMPTTKMMEMGTQVMGAASAGAGGTVKVAAQPASAPAPAAGANLATRVASPAEVPLAVTSGTAPAKKKSWIPVAAVAAVVVLAGGYAAFRGHAAVSDTTNHTAVNADSAKLQGGKNPPAPTPGTGTVAPPPSTGTAPAPRALSPGELNAKISSLDDASSDSAITPEKGKLVARQIVDLENSNKGVLSAEQNVRLEIARASALMVGDQAAGCPIFKKIKQMAEGTRYESQVNQQVGHCP